jgi:hypothetical protein
VLVFNATNQKNIVQIPKECEDKKPIPLHICGGVIVFIRVADVDCWIVIFQGLN